MAEMATNVGTQQRTGIANAALVRGVRCTRNASGTLDVQDATARGDYVTGQDIEAGKPGVVYEMGGGGKVAALFNGAIAVGALAYAGANGQFSPTSTNAALCGRCTLAASGSGVLGEVELFEVA
jgi:hypothetical protein